MVRFPIARKPPLILFNGVALAGILLFLIGAIVASAFYRGGREAPANVIGGAFTLTDHNGNRFTEADLKGRWHLVYFGYTRCPDVCPTALNNLSLALQKLEAWKAKIRIVFISVDPERDTPQVMKAYVESFSGPIVGLTGTAEEVAQAAKDYEVYYSKDPTADGGYEIDHSALIYIMDPRGRFAAKLSADDPPDTMVARLRRLIEPQAGACAVRTLRVAAYPSMVIDMA